VRALKIAPGPDSSPATDVLRRWAQRRREAVLEQRLDRLARAVERLVALLERRAA